MYLAAAEGIGCGSSWNWECAPCLQAWLKIVPTGIKSRNTASQTHGSKIDYILYSEVMRSLEKVWVRTRAKSSPFPAE